MTVGELRKAIADLPDDLTVLVAYEGSVTMPAFRLVYEGSRDEDDFRILVDGDSGHPEYRSVYPALTVVAP